MTAPKHVSNQQPAIKWHNAWIACGAEERNGAGSRCSGHYSISIAIRHSSLYPDYSSLSLQR